MHPGIADGFRAQGISEEHFLIAGEFPRVSRYVRVMGEGILTAGSVLGREDASGQYTLSASAATDGSQMPDAILAEDIDVSQPDSLARVYLSGEFHSHVLTLGEGHSIESVWQLFRLRSIFLR